MKRPRRTGSSGTDDASLVERIGVSVRMIPGDHDNIKMTTPEDLELGAIIIRRFSSEQPGGQPDRMERRPRKNALPCREAPFRAGSFTAGSGRGV